MFSELEAALDIYPLAAKGLLKLRFSVPFSGNIVLRHISGREDLGGPLTHTVQSERFNLDQRLRPFGVWLGSRLIDV